MKRPLLAVLAACSAAWLPSFSAAHTVWVQPDAAPGVFRVFFGGHEGKLETYLPEKLISAEAYDAMGRRLKVDRTDAADGVRLKPAAGVALIAMHYENGIFSRTPEGRSVNLPMSKVPGSTRATNAVKYHKTILVWSPFVAQPLGQPFEVTPLSATQPQAGQPMRVRVTVSGKPAPGVKLGRGEDSNEAVTDARGEAAFVPSKGFNKIWAGQRTNMAGNSEYTELSYEYLLGFEAR